MFNKAIDYKKALSDFRYDRQNGVLIWRTGKFKGEVVGTTNSSGYRVADWQGKKWYIHRIVGAILTKSDMVGKTVDHKNYVKTDNRPENIYVGTQRENLLRRRSSGRKTLRYTGIVKRNYSYGTRYIATIVVNGTRHRSKPYKTQKAAYDRYVKLFVKYNGVQFLPPDMLQYYLKQEA